MDQAHTSTSKKTSSQTRVVSSKSRTNSLKPATKVSKITHSLTQSKITTKPAPLTRTSIGATRSSDAETFRQPQSSEISQRPKTSSSRSSRSTDKGSSAMQTKSTIIVAPTPNRSKHTPEVTHHSNQQSMTSADRTTTLSSKNILNSTERKKSISTLTEKSTSSSSTGTSTTQGHPKQTTGSISTKHEASSLSSKHQASTATSRGSKKLSSTGSRVSSASIIHQSIMTTATQGQSASVPHPTTATRMKTSSHPIQTVITGSKGTVVTYEATRDPKYTTNTKTTTSTSDHGDRVIIYPGGWRWRPIGFPHLKLPPFKLPPPPALNPDPESRDHDHDHDHDHDKSSKSTTKCITTRPPRCTKTVSFISTGTGYTSTILGTCSPVSGCVSGEQSTTTTTIATFVPSVWIDEPYNPEVPTPPEEVDAETIKYFNDLFKKEGISLEVDRQLVAHCGGNTPGIPLFCLNTFSTDFCRPVQADPSKNLSKTFAGLDATLGPIGPLNMIGDHHVGMQKRRSLVSRGLCSDWSFEFNWSGAHSKCGKSCLDYLSIIRTQCLQFKTNNEGSLDAGCGTYSLVIKPVPTTSTTSTAESPPEPTEIPKTPLELKPAVCADESNFPGHVDVHKSDQKRQAESFCETYFLDRNQKGIHMSSQNETVSATGGGLFGDALLHFSVSWVDGCETTVDSQDVMLPVGDDFNLNCGNILFKTWADCNNGGVGGYIDAGCLRYQFNPAK
ncbi:hypothetical protein J3E68DRAFT_440897 [Trichoderma sp. SZMC 28012]